MDQLKQARAAINAIDEKMAALFEARMQAVEDVLAYKLAHHLPVLDESREQEVLERNCALLQNQDLREYYAQYQKALMEVSKRYQRAQLYHDTVGYQGIEGAFSYIATTHLFPEEKKVAYQTFAEVFRAVANKVIAYGVIPFENSYTGEVGEVLDLLFEYDVHIVGSYDLAIDQYLLGVPGATIADIKQIYSHHQAISQCQEYLNRLQVEVVPYANTALAAKYVSEANDKTKAAIASAETAGLFGLAILAGKINTSAQNTTRFMVIAAEEKLDGNRFNLLFTVGHNAGQLANVMGIIGEFGFNLESIKSRPLRHLPWQYYFYVEVIGQLDDPHTQALLAKLRQTCDSLKVLGSYTIPI